jgi:hypothetical protein
LEIYFNGLFGFTSTELHNLSEPYYGIKPWEISARFEPVGFLKKKNITGVIFSLGTIYNFFPDVATGGGEAVAKDNFVSGKLKRMGLKLGAGGRLKEKFEWMAGAGLQLRAVTIWGLYGFDEKKGEIAFGLNDISWLKYLLPYME